MGIQGKEGNQASSFADYAVPRFKDLRRAIFWHGTFFGVRIENYVLWCLYKAIFNSMATMAMNF